MTAAVPWKEEEDEDACWPWRSTMWKRNKGDNMILITLQCVSQDRMITQSHSHEGNFFFHYTSYWKQHPGVFMHLLHFIIHPKAASLSETASQCKQYIQHDEDAGWRKMRGRRLTRLLNIAEAKLSPVFQMLRLPMCLWRCLGLECERISVSGRLHVDPEITQNTQIYQG